MITLEGLELNKIFNEDCLAGMNKIPDKSIDMILCDLPYGTTRNKWDSILPLGLLWEQYERVIKDNGAIVLTAQTPFDKVLGASNLKLLKYEWIWEKDRATGHLNANKMPMKAHENILVFYRKLPTYNKQITYGHKPMNVSYCKGDYNQTNYGSYKHKPNTERRETRLPRSVIKHNVVKTPKNYKRHPTQKPLSLFEYLIKTYTNEGEIVLDNCMGSGTTAIACMNTNRNFIGFELDESYYKASLERIESNK